MTETASVWAIIGNAFTMDIETFTMGSGRELQARYELDGGPTGTLRIDPVAQGETREVEACLVWDGIKYGALALAGVSDDIKAAAAAGELGWELVEVRNG